MRIRKFKTRKEIDERIIEVLENKAGIMPEEKDGYLKGLKWCKGESIVG